MRLISYKCMTRQVAESIDEFTPAQYRRYLEISLLADRGAIGKAGLRSKLLTLLLDEKTDISMLSPMATAEAMKHIELTKPFILEGERRDRLNLESGINPLKEWNGWKGVGDMLSGLNFGGFIDCDSLLRMISKSESAKRREDLTMEFCKKLYSCPGRPDENPDELLCAHSLVLFNNVMQMLHNEPIDFNGEPLDFSILFDKADRRKADDRTGWSGAALDIAETGVFGTYSQVLETPLWNVLLYLYRKKFDYLHNHSKTK